MFFKKRCGARTRVTRTRGTRTHGTRTHGARTHGVHTLGARTRVPPRESLRVEVRPVQSPTAGRCPRSAAADAQRLIQEMRPAAYR